MDFGAAIFFTDYSMGPAELGRALEERGFESLWAPEHSHIPLSRQSPFPSGGEQYLGRDLHGVLAEQSSQRVEEGALSVRAAAVREEQGMCADVARQRIPRCPPQVADQLAVAGHDAREEGVPCRA